MPTEQQYLKKIAEGDTKAFDSLFMIYYPRVKNFALSLIKNEEDASDIAQDIFLKVWNNREKLPKLDSFKAYLFQMTKNSVFDYFRQNIVFENYLASQTKKAPEIELPENVIEARDLELLIDIVIENMPQQRKKIFNMSRKEGLTNDEIAENLNISKRTVETHISKALADLRKVVSCIFMFFI